MNTRAIYQRWKADIMRGASSKTLPPSPEALIQRLREAPSHVGYREAFALLSEAADALASSQEALRAAERAEDAALRIVERYATVARVIALHLCDFCDDSLMYDEMIAEASRRAAAALQAKEQEIARLSRELEKWKPREHTVRVAQMDSLPDAKPTLGTQGSPATFKASSGAETP